ncbi:MAG: hypothetical protein HY696_08835 [Deltaproteobacteria bacterium]|nr:hypothetical protein [Deltaproteobacteria bacterium]
MQILIIGDSLAKLRPQSDTSLALAHAALQRGHAVWWGEAERVVFWERATMTHAVPLTACVSKSLPVVGAETRCAIDQFDLVVIRKDPPFDDSYVRLCWLLLPYEGRVTISNRPSALLTHHEKMIPWLARAAGALRDDEVHPTCVTADAAVARDYVLAHPAPAWVVKPWLGFGGGAVQQAADAAAVAALVAAASEPQLVQPLLPAVATGGDRRVFLLGGRVVGSLVRIPKPGSIVSNLAAGGRAELRPMDAATQDRCERLARYLHEAQIDFAGADCIAGIVSEVNITSPTGLVALTRIDGEDLVPQWLDLLEGRVWARP